MNTSNKMFSIVEPIFVKLLTPVSLAKLDTKAEEFQIKLESLGNPFDLLTIKTALFMSIHFATLDASNIADLTVIKTICTHLEQLNCVLTGLEVAHNKRVGLMTVTQAS